MDQPGSIGGAALPRLLAELRAADAARHALLPSLSFFCYAVRAGLDRGSGQDPTAALDGSVLGLAATVELARTPGPAQEDARWLLDRLGVTPAELGLEGPVSAEPDALQATIARLEAVTERLWLLVTTPEPEQPPEAGRPA